MVSILQRIAVPFVAFLAGTGLEVSGFEDVRLALALWAFALLWLLVAFATWSPVQSRLPKLPYTVTVHKKGQPKIVVPLSPVEKGFLDFIVEFQEGGKRLTKLIEEIGHKTRKMGENIARQTPPLQAAKKNPIKARSIASRIARDMDRFSSFVEGSLPNLNSYSEGMTGSWASHIKWKIEHTGLTDADREEVRTATTIFRNASRMGRSSISGMRDSVQGLRDTAVSQEINRATEHRLLPALNDVIGTLRSLERSCLSILQMVQTPSTGARSTGRKKVRRKR